MGLVIMDRDGVLNADVGAPGVTRARDLALIPRAALAVRLANDRGVTVCVATNQSAIGKGLVDEAYVTTEIHGELAAALAREGDGATIDGGIFMCATTREKEPDCERRKPAPGMVLEALARFGVEARRAVFIGDTMTDMQAAARAGGVRRALVCTGYGRVMGEALKRANVELPTTLTSPTDDPTGTVPRECFPVRVYEDAYQAMEDILA